MASPFAIPPSRRRERAIESWELAREALLETGAFKASARARERAAAATRMSPAGKEHG